jgi:hypothetical protein
MGLEFLDLVDFTKILETLHYYHIVNLLKLDILIMEDCNSI